MRIVMVVLLLAHIGDLPAQAQRYHAPSGNCDAAVMQLEAASRADASAAARLSAVQQGKGDICASPAIEATDARLSAAGRLSKRVDGVLMACPGMDAAMAHGEKIVGPAKEELSRITAARQTLASSCGNAIRN